MAYGTKYVDKNTGTKILYHSPTQTTLVLDKAGDVVVTSYKQQVPKEVWIKKIGEQQLITIIYTILYSKI